MSTAIIVLPSRLTHFFMKTIVSHQEMFYWFITCVSWFKSFHLSFDCFYVAQLFNAFVLNCHRYIFTDVIIKSWYHSLLNLQECCIHSCCNKLPSSGQTRQSPRLTLKIPSHIKHPLPTPTRRTIPSVYWPRHWPQGQSQVTDTTVVVKERGTRATNSGSCSWVILWRPR